VNKAKSTVKDITMQCIIIVVITLCSL